MADALGAATALFELLGGAGAAQGEPYILFETLEGGVDAALGASGPFETAEGWAYDSAYAEGQEPFPETDFQGGSELCQGAAYETVTASAYEIYHAIGQLIPGFFESLQAEGGGQGLLVDLLPQGESIAGMTTYTSLAEGEVPFEVLVAAGYVDMPALGDVTVPRETSAGRGGPTGRYTGVVLSYQRGVI